MLTIRTCVAAGASIVFAFANFIDTAAAANFGVGSSESFAKQYVQFRSQQLNTSNPQALTVPLGYVKGVSVTFSQAAGRVTFDLTSGNAALDLKGLRSGQQYSVWCLERDESERTLSSTSRALKLTDIVASGSSMQVNTNLQGALPSNFTFDRVVLSTGNAAPDAVAAAGSISVFQKIFFRRFTLIDGSTDKVLFRETTRAPAFASIVPDIRRELSSSSSNVLAVDRLISRGAQLFFENKFGGNGRTCGTCHPKENNFSLDRAFIASLPKNNPLFVAEFNPTLAQLERPKLMREFGLILENLDGVEDPANKFVMRGVSHTLGMGTSLAQDKTQPNPPAQMTGWSGDGAPGAGSLRDFATGAVTQHLPRSLNRVAGVDFTLPNELQLDAMEAFQLSLGREKDFVLTAIRFNDANVENGKQVFLNGTGDPNAGNRCSVCHVNAGALAVNGQNGNFNTRVEDAMHPAQSVQPFPKDGGFGQGLNATGTFGNNTFNTASVVEAADTPPFFHNNLVNTLEEVVDFYAGPEFNKDVPPAAQFSFTPQQTSDIANFMRGINTLQNIDVAVRELRLTLNLPSSSAQEIGEIVRRLTVANLDVRDGTTVLQQGKLYPTAVTELSAARRSIDRARRESPSDRRALTQRAIFQLGKARQIIAN